MSLITFTTSVRYVVVDVNREKVPGENLETKVSQVGLVDPVQPGYVGQTAQSLGGSKAAVDYLVTTATRVILELQEHLAVQVRGH